MGDKVRVRKGNSPEGPKIYVKWKGRGVKQLGCWLAAII